MAAQNALTSLIVNNTSHEFQFGGRSPIRVIQREGEPWFIAKDVAESLDYTWNGTKTIGHVPDEWRGVESVSTPSGTQDMHTLSEQGLYFFLGRSDKPKALPFQKFVAGDVMPNLRKLREASLAKNTANLAQPLYILDLRINAANILGVPLHIAQVEAVKEVKVRCGEDFTDLLRLAPAQQNIKQEDLMLEPTEIGKRIGLTPSGTNKKLAELGLQVKINDSWAPTVLGKPFCTTHQWTVGSKSGYNLKWNVAEVERRIRIESEMSLV